MFSGIAVIETDFTVVADDKEQASSFILDAVEEDYTIDGTETFSVKDIKQVG